MANKAIAKVCPKWQMGAKIQDAWPEGSATERETLISGFCPSCQKVIFGEPDNEL